MNQDLKQWYSGLQAFERNKLKQQFYDSPKAMLLLEFLDNHKDKNFRTAEAVQWVYRVETDDYSILQNRYFKLRKKLIESIKTKGAGSGSYVLEAEEAAYFNCRTLVSRSNYASARKELSALYKRCLSLNAFELLPGILHQLVYCNQALNIFQENISLFKEQEEAVQLLHNLGVQQVLSRKAFHECVTRGFDAAQKELKQMHQIALRNESYPRFLLNYHFTSFSLGSISAGNKVHALSRHLTGIEKILEKHPSLPTTSFEPNYLNLQKFYLCSSKGAYYFLKGDMEQCYVNFRESWDILEKNPELRVRKSDNYFRNKMRVEISAERYTEALNTCSEWMEHIRSQKRNEDKLFVYTGMLEVYSYAFPGQRSDNAHFLLARTEELIRHLKRYDPQRLLGETYAHKAMFLFVNRMFNEALATAQAKECTEFLKQRKMEIYGELFKLPFETTEEKKKALSEKIKKQLFKSTNADSIFPLKWALRMIKHAG